MVNRPSLTVVMDGKGVAAAERFIANPLSADGIDWVHILANGKKPLVKIDETEAPYFTSVAPTIPLTSNEVDFALTIEAPVFKEGNNWRCRTVAPPFMPTLRTKSF